MFSFPCVVEVCASQRCFDGPCHKGLIHLRQLMVSWYRRHHLSGPDTEDETQEMELVGLWLIFERMLECYSHRMKP